ncbi:hypothetical protein N9D31_01550 [Oligoflexaceae bacterium]|nr:hypothetical protein [Oligoflexaceae bacterium]
MARITPEDKQGSLMYSNAKKLDFAIPVLVSKTGSGKPKETSHVNALAEHGLILLSSTQWEVGEKITVHFLKETIAFSVEKTETENGSVYSSYLVTENSSIDLNRYFSSFFQLVI